MGPPPPARRPRRRGAPPPLPGPPSGSALPVAAAADGDPEASVSTHACVTLKDWWLVSVEGDEQKVAVAGTFERNQTIQDYPPAPIAKRLTPNVLETEDGTILRIHDGLHNVSKTYRNGYSEMVCAEFQHGFPDCWQSCKQLYPKPTNTHAGDSTQYLMDLCHVGNRLISNFHEISGNYSHNDAAFKNSSHLLNGKPRIEEYTSDDDITTNENVAATGNQKTPVVSMEVSGCLSNRTQILEEYTCNGDIPTNEDAAAPNDDNERCTAASKEVNIMEIGLVMVMGSPSRERGHGDIATDVSLAPAVECINNAVSQSVHSTPATSKYRKKTPVASLKSQGSRRENQHIASNKKSVRQPKKQISPDAKCQSATRSPGTSNLPSYVLWSPLTHDKAKSLSLSTPEDLKLKRSRSDRKKTSLKSQGSWRENQHIASTKKLVDWPKQISPREKCQSATRFPVTRTSVSCAHWSLPTRGKDTSWSMTPVEALNLKRSRSGRIMVPKLEEGYQSIAYGTGGSIIGVIGLDSPALPKWSESKTDRRKKRKSK